MKICVAQARPVTGDIQRNIANHKKLIDLAVSRSADAIFFPELSLTGYEPTLANALATHQEDSRLDDFQTISNTRQITIGVGIPTKDSNGIYISMILFQPHAVRQTYSKKYLHADEKPFFMSGKSFPILQIQKANVAPAICYELSVPAHAERAHQNGATIYIASVAKSASGVAKAGQRLSDIAGRYAMAVLMSNCVGPSDNFESAGGSSVWNNKGVLMEQLDNANEGILIYDTDTQQLITLSSN
ncbi:MAG: carbon-nitrogen hydrolase family protein [Anaerolineales bacterium]|nr:carbon-nitrogen hydrolase family protein [Anaerolineales bacterium]MCA9928784.1 carbon-nitrogen hydrolase family protein [Anaerolineales bacterium]